jgi:2-oxoglutarate dehydrogenase E2 component (dihydrolipoamide succinyltransferase)
VRRLAVEHGLDLASVTGTGAGGRIKKSDLLAALEAPAPPPPAPEPAPARDDSMVSEALARKDVLTPAVTKALADKGLEASQVPASGLGGRLTRADVEGFSGSPAPAPVPTPAPTPSPSAASAGPSAARGFVEVEVDFERIARVRGSISEVAFVARAALDAIRATDGVDGPLGFVVGDDAGIAVLADAGDLRLEGLARRIAEVSPTDAAAGLVIAHPGALGATRSVPSIPTSGAPLLSVNAVRRQPAVVAGPTGEESLAIRSIGALGLVWDATTLTHGTALGFLQRVRDNLESWAWEQELT